MKDEIFVNVEVRMVVRMVVVKVVMIVVGWDEKFAS